MRSGRKPPKLEYVITTGCRTEGQLLRNRKPPVLLPEDEGMNLPPRRHFRVKKGLKEELLELWNWSWPVTRYVIIVVWIIFLVIALEGVAH